MSDVKEAIDGVIAAAREAALAATAPRRLCAALVLLDATTAHAEATASRDSCREALAALDRAPSAARAALEVAFEAYAKRAVACWQALLDARRDAYFRVAPVVTSEPHCFDEERG